jgi:hypothetical protein
MPELAFAVEGAEAVPFAAAPALALKLRVTARPEGAEVHSVLLRCQVQIDAPRRSYGPEEQERLRDLFGEPARWSSTLRGVLWTNATVLVSGFRGSTLVDVPLPCGHDFTTAALKYLYAVDDGDVPLTLLFSGTVFHAGDDGALAVAPIPWSCEARYRLRARLYHLTIEHYFPGQSVLAIRRDLFDRLERYRRSQGLPTCDAALDRLLAEASPS